MIAVYERGCYSDKYTSFMEVPSVEVAELIEGPDHGLLAVFGMLVTVDITDVTEFGPGLRGCIEYGKGDLKRAKTGGDYIRRTPEGKAKQIAACEARLKALRALAEQHGVAL